MAKTLKTAQSKHEAATGFPVPFSLETLHDDLPNIFLHHLRLIGWMIDEETAWLIMKDPLLALSKKLHYTNLTAAEIGITYEHIQKTAFAVHMEFLYNYAFFGRIDANMDVMEEESIYTWYSALICDAARGEVTMEYDAWGTAGPLESALRCLHVIETANARVTLEGAEPFFNRFQGGKEGYLKEGFLTIRQMALLSGMEEMSVRAAANPKRSNPLKTVNTEDGTHIEIAVAKEWLQQKGRYVPISYDWVKGEIDLFKHHFTNIREFDSTLYSRFRLLKKKGNIHLEEQLNAAGVESVSSIAGTLLNHDPNDPAKVARLEEVGRLLELEPQLLYLRIKEAHAKGTLFEVQYALRDLARAS